MDLGSWSNLKMADIEPYIQLSLEWRKRYFRKRDGKRKQIKQIFKFRDCTKQDFQNTEFEKGFWNYINVAKKTWRNKILRR